MYEEERKWRFFQWSSASRMKGGACERCFPQPATEVAGRKGARVPKQHAQPWRAPLRASGARPSSELARTPREECDEPGPLCNPRAEMHARTETREKASEGMRPSSEVTPESQQARGGGTKTPETM